MAEAKKRDRSGVVYSEVGAEHRGMLAQIVAMDRSDVTKTLRFLIEQEYKRRELPTALKGKKLVAAFGTEKGKRTFAVQEQAE